MLLAHVLALHIDNASFLPLLRERAVGSPHYRLKDILKLDERIRAHLDGILLAGDDGWSLCREQLEQMAFGEIFAATAIALEAGRWSELEALFSLAEGTPPVRSGLCAAFGWVSPSLFRGVMDELLASGCPLIRETGIAACGVHRLDPGDALVHAMDDPDGSVRAAALRAAGELGRCELVARCRIHLAEKDACCRFWAAWSAVLLGDPFESWGELEKFCLSSSPWREQALQLAPRALTPQQSKQLLKRLGDDPTRLRQLVQAVGMAGDPEAIPWLIAQMRNPELARVAGESFATITGLDISDKALKSRSPADFRAGPTEDSDDEDVAMDEDEDLPWPDPLRIQRWWDAHSHRFANGVQYFLGEPPESSQLEQVLRNGYQRQRIGAALYLVLIRPGAPLFEWRAPAWRQMQALENLAHNHSNGR